MALVLGIGALACAGQLAEPPVAAGGDHALGTDDSQIQESVRMATQPLAFGTTDPGENAGQAPLLQAWTKVPLDPETSGGWVATGDLTGDGKADIVSARNVNSDDVHYTSAVAAQDLTGRVLWRWGDFADGRRGWHHDVACQIYDWDGDGANEVILCTKGFLVELDGATGRERRRLPIPPEATDCLVFANLSGGARATDVLIKDRYTQIWALNHDGKLLWTVKQPGGFRTAHQPLPVDLDGDGRDEVMAGFAMLNPDGRVRWMLSNVGNLAAGHLDCCRVLRRGKTPADWRFVLTACGAKMLLACDGNGQVQWEVGGHHFESIDVGRIVPDRPGAHILVDLVSERVLWVLDENGERLGQLTLAKADYNRFHTLIDWNGDGVEEIVLPYCRGLFDGRGKRLGTFAMEAQSDVYAGKPPTEGEVGNIVLRGDMDGDGVADVTITAPYAVYVFRNPTGLKAEKVGTLGCGTNFTLY